MRKGEHEQDREQRVIQEPYHGDTIAAPAPLVNRAYSRTSGTKRTGMTLRWRTTPSASFSTSSSDCTA